MLGRSFTQELLAAVTELDEAALAEALDRLVAAELVHRLVRADSLVYEFKHALVQDAAYRSMLHSRRQNHHALIAKVLESQFSSATEPELLAHHLTEAGRTEQAIDHWLKATLFPTIPFDTTRTRAPAS